MTEDISVTVSVEDESTPQLNEVRAEYVDGDLDEDELAEHLEDALENGAPIGDDTRPLEPVTGFDWLTTRLTGPVIDLLLRLAEWRGDNFNTEYDWRRHIVTVVDTDPDADDHPAESAGALQMSLQYFPLMLSYAALAVQTGRLSGMTEPSVTSMLVALQVPLFAIICFMILRGPKPTVDMTDRGLGQHIARGDHHRRDA